MTKKYYELFKRNQHIISLDTQNKIKVLNVLIAGCGSVGGAFIEGASRLGVLNYKLVEPDNYDTHNLNRQFVYPSNIGFNKASVQADRLRSLLEDCDPKIEVEQEGVNESNIEKLLCGIDLIFDGVDVTTTSGMKAKLLLHEYACEKNIPVISALDLGFTQWICYNNYRTLESPLNGKFKKASECIHPLKSLVEGFCPLENWPPEILEELIKLLTIPDSNACQLGSCCHLLAGFTGPLIIRFCENKPIPEVTSFDLMRALENDFEKNQSREKQLMLVRKAQNFLLEIK